MMLNACSSVQDYLLREIIRRGMVVSITSLACQLGLERCHLHVCARQLEREGKITITREYKNGPLILRPVSNYQPVHVGLTYQLPLFSGERP